MIRRFGVALGVVCSLLAGPTALAAESWPLAGRSVQLFGPISRADGGVWCGRAFDGSYGSVYFGNAETWVNYGGTCNAQWGQPASWVQSRVRVQVNGGIWSQATGTNAANSYVAQATVNRVSFATSYQMAGAWYDGSAGAWVLGGWLDASIRN